VRQLVAELAQVYSTSTPDNLTTRYMADYYTTVMACTDQHQLCNTAKDKCTELGAFNPFMSGSVGPWTATQQFLGLNSAQVDVFQVILTGLSNNYNMYQSIKGLRTYALRAQETLDDLEQVALPNNQWEIEAQGWYETNLAKLQQGIVQYATGPSEVKLGMNLVANSTFPHLCRAQKVRTTNSTISFSVLGLVLVLVLCVVIIILSVCLESMFNFVIRWWLPDRKYMQDCWVQDDKLQLQRRAYEANGLGDWRGHSSAVPVTQNGDQFAVAEHGITSGSAVK